MGSIIKIYRKGLPCEIIVSEEDFEYFSQFSWCLDKRGYIARTTNKKDVGVKTARIKMHREVFRLQGISIPADLVPDHINRNRLDNRRENLRLATASQNASNVSEEDKKRRTEIIVTYNKTPMTEEQLLKKRIQFQKNKPLSPKVVNTKTGKVYSGIAEASREIGMHFTTMWRYLTGRAKNKTDFKFYEEKITQPVDDNCPHC